jgi:hypothetical protein
LPIGAAPIKQPALIGMTDVRGAFHYHAGGYAYRGGVYGYRSGAPHWGAAAAYGNQCGYYSAGGYLIPNMFGVYASDTG